MAQSVSDILEPNLFHGSIITHTEASYEMASNQKLSYLCETVLCL